MQPMRLFRLMPWIALESCLNELPQYLGSSNTCSSINELMNFQVSIFYFKKKNIPEKKIKISFKYILSFEEKNSEFFCDISENNWISVIDAKVK